MVNPSEDPAFANFTWSDSLPVLVMNGDMDMQTTTEEARLSAAQFKNVRFVRVKSAPHVVIQASPCAAQALVEFVLTQNVANPDACLNDNPFTWAMGAAPKTNLSENK
jgi:TAP-like protein